MRRVHTILVAAAVALAAALAAGCHDLPDLRTCGNGVVEEANGEACDDGPTGSEACTAACALSCKATALTPAYVDVADGRGKFCPGAQFRCGGDDICRAPSGFFEALGPALPFDVGDTPTTGDVDNDGLVDLVGASATNIYIRFASTAGTPLGELIVQEAPSSDAPPVIFDPRPTESNAVRSDLLFAVPTEGVALLQSDNERFAPELELPIEVNAEALGIEAIGVVVRDPDPVARYGDVVVAVARTSASPSIFVGRVRVKAPDDDPQDPAVEGMALPACAGSGAGAWSLVHVEPAADRRSFVVVTRRTAGAGWHVCRYTQSAGGWIRADLDFPAPAAAPLEARLANLDGDACLELAVRDATQLLKVEAAEPGCDFLPGASPVPIQGALDQLLAAGPIVPGGIDELVLRSGLYRRCPGPEDCDGAAPGAFALVTRPTKGLWSAAGVADLNGDGVLDVVAARLDEADVDVVRGGERPNVYRATTSAPVRGMVAGDFDGDRLDDMAMAETSPAGDRIVVLFGTREATVDAPRAMSGPSGPGSELRLDRFREMGWIASSRGTDGIDDLGVVRFVPPMPNQPMEPIRAGFALGDAARLMTTPRFPPTATVNVPLNAVAAGAFRDGGVELLAISGDRALFYPAAALMNARWSAPGPAGLAIHHPIRALRGPAPVRGVASLSPGGRELVVFSVSGDAIREVCRATAAGTRLNELRSVDIDGDGVDEVAVVSDRGDPGTRSLEILSAATCRPLPTEVFRGCADVANVGAGLVAVCRLADPDMGPARGLFAIRPGAAERTFMRSFPVGDARFVTPGDFDGDGVTDVALSLHRVDEIVIHYLRQCPAHDTRDCPFPAR